MYSDKSTGHPGDHNGDPPRIPRQRGGGHGDIDDRTTAEKFEAHVRRDPHVYSVLTRLARRYQVATGEDQQSMQRIFEIARWDEKVRTKGEGDFELNNDFAAFYARLIMWLEPDLRGAFQIRRSVAADAWIAEKRRAA